MIKVTMIIIIKLIIIIRRIHTYMYTYCICMKILSMAPLGYHTEALHTWSKEVRFKACSVIMFAA